MLKIIVYIVSIYIISDILIYLIFSILEKKDFKWLIDEGDENPKFEKRKFEYFLKKVLIEKPVGIEKHLLVDTKFLIKKLILK